MAKRRRLGPAQGLIPETSLMAGRPPIAQVAGESAALGALDDLRMEWDKARQSGRFVLSLPLDNIEADHLHRDRIAQDDEAMQSLIDSLRTRGQQVPIEVVELAPDRYGLLSGWRRLMALRRLREETGIGEVQALLRRPKDAPQAYLSMVEENEIRADLSHYERARIVLKAVEVGVFETQKSALQSLFAASSYARRSKIKSFIPIVQSLDGALRFPQAISERLGLSLSRALQERSELAAQISASLASSPAVSPEAEITVLSDFLKPQPTQKTVSDPPDSDMIGDISLTAREGRAELRGQGVNADFIDRLKTWLAEQA